MEKRVKKIKQKKRVKKIKSIKGLEDAPLDGPKLQTGRYDGKTGHRTEAGQRLLMAQIAVCISESKTVEETCEELEIRMQEYELYKERLYANEEATHAGRTELQIYTDYVLKQTKLMRDLETLKKTFGTSRQYNALVGAVKAQSEILDKIITRGQELGIISKTPESINVIAGLDVRNMTDIAIRNQIRDELDRAERLLAETTGKPPKAIKVLTPGKEEVNLDDLKTVGEA